MALSHDFPFRLIVTIALFFIFLGDDRKERTQGSIFSSAECLIHSPLLRAFLAGDRAGSFQGARYGQNIYR